MRALVVAKAPHPGLVKTRLAVDTGPEVAADLAAAALLDTLARCTEAFGAGSCHLALAGELPGAARETDIVAALHGWTVFGQVGDTFAARLLHAHEHLGGGDPVVQVGMDTPQLDPDLLRVVAASITKSGDVVLGPAADGGWWLLVHRNPALLRGIVDVSMSRPDTGRRTREALEEAGADVLETVPLRDVDTLADAATVARGLPDSHFARAFLAVPR